MHRGQKPSLPSPATLEISRKDRIRRQGQMPQGAELLCLVGPGHGHPASPPSVPLQVMQQIASGFKSAEVTSATLSAADAALARRHRYFRRRLVHDCRPGWELVAQLYSGCGRKVVSNSGVVPSERYRKFGLSAGANEIRNLGLAVYGPRRGRAANRHLAGTPASRSGISLRQHPGRNFRESGTEGSNPLSSSGESAANSEVGSTEKGRR